LGADQRLRGIGDLRFEFVRRPRAVYAPAQTASGVRGQLLREPFREPGGSPVGPPTAVRRPAHLHLGGVLRRSVGQPLGDIADCVEGADERSCPLLEGRSVATFVD